MIESIPTSTINNITNMNIEINQFNDYINDIVNQIDDTVKPCDNFAQYVCGNISDDIQNFHTTFLSSSSSKLTNQLYIEELLLQNDDINEISNSEKQAKKFYLSCIKNGNENNKKNNIKKLFNEINSLKEYHEKWPIININNNDDKNNTNNKIIKLIGELTSLNLMDIINLKIMKNHEIILKYQKIDTNLNDIIEKMTEFGTSTKIEIEETSNKLEKFITTINNIIESSTTELHENDTNTNLTIINLNNQNINDLIHNFNWNLYFDTITNNLQISSSKYLINKLKQIQNPEIIQKLINVLMKNDNQLTIINYLIWKYISSIDIPSTQCKQKFELYYRPAILKKLWRQYSSNDDITKRLNILNNFVKNFDNIKKTLNNPSDHILETIILPRIKFIENDHEKFFNINIENYYKIFDVDTDNFYQNSIKYYQSIMKYLIITDGDNDFNKIYDLMSSISSTSSLEYLPMDIDINGHNKPILYYSISENIDLLKLVYEYGNKIEWNKKLLPVNCLPYHDINKNKEYLQLYPAYYLGYYDYMNIIKNMDMKMLQEQNVLLNELNLNHQKIFFLALGQYQCVKNGGTKSLKREILTYFRHFRKFAETFECAKNDLMDDSSCDPNVFTRHEFL